MGWISGIIVYVLSWWVVLFAVLPFGWERDETGKPRNFKPLRVVLVTSLMAAAVWLIIYGLIESDIISFRDLARGMSEKDKGL